MIIVIRIHGQVGLSAKVNETLSRLKLKRKFATTLVDGKDKVIMGMVEKVRGCVAYGEIDDKLAERLIASRGETLMGKKVDNADKILKEILAGKWTIKKFFRLHPPIGGFRKSTKFTYPKGILAKNNDISKLVERMI